jgi:hypothetical protein
MNDRGTFFRTARGSVPSAWQSSSSQKSAAILIVSAHIVCGCGRAGSDSPAEILHDQRFKLANLKVHLLVYADEHNGRFPATLSDLEFSGPELISRSLLLYEDPFSREQGDWVYSPGHSTNAPDGTIVISAPRTYFLRGENREEFRLVLQVENGTLRVRSLRIGTSTAMSQLALPMEEMMKVLAFEGEDAARAFSLHERLARISTYVEDATGEPLAIFVSVGVDCGKRKNPYEGVIFGVVLREPKVVDAITFLCEVFECEWATSERGLLVYPAHPGRTDQSRDFDGAVLAEP